MGNLYAGIWDVSLANESDLGTPQRPLWNDI